MTTEKLSVQQRAEILDGEIAKYTKRGFRVQSRTQTSAQLIKPKQFSCLWATLWLLLLVVGLIIYLFYFWAKKDEVVFISVDEYGKISVKK